ncbi:unnamed protein product [Lupinus luteus]|uniref:DUF4378 domain-containing protein n=1 Tax=Lupinus luteus TaxID=3873 RepID=A0AAV1WYB3_LUPLU
MRQNIPEDTIMYRSFVKCDDPKGVVECGKIRKYRICSQKVKDMVKIQKIAENTSLINKRNKEEKVPKGSIEKFFDPSSLQFTQVSGGDQSLNNMIDSRSSILMKQDRRSEDIAKKLLNGALDLQDSLVMLTKLQDDSEDMHCLKRELEEKPKRDRIETKMIGTTYANQFSDQSDYPMGCQRPQPSDDGSSSNCEEKVKKMFKESSVWQNLFQSTAVERFDSASETPTSPSHFSAEVRIDRFSDLSNSLTVSKVERRPGLVAKLMGLEEAPSSSCPFVVQKQLDGEKVLNQKRPTFELDMFKVRKNSSIIEKANPERKTLRETLETMHFKGILKKSFVKEPKLQIHHFNGPSSKRFDDLSHIFPPYQQSVKPHVPYPPDVLSPTKMKADLVSSKTIKPRKCSGSTNMRNEMGKDVSKRHTKEVFKLDAKGINTIESERCSGKVKLHCQVSHISQLNETSDIKCKVQNIRRKLPENDISEPRFVASPQLKKHMKNQSPFSESEAAKQIAEQIEQGDVKKSFGDPCKGEYTEIRIYTSVSVADEFLMQCETDASTIKTGEEYKQSNSSSSDDIMLQESMHENCSIPSEEEHENTNCSGINSLHAKEGAELKHFLLTSQSYISHAERLFNLDVDCPEIFQKDETNEINANLRLYLDCANEFTELKSLQESQAVRSFALTCAGNSMLHISLCKLVEEIYNAIENMKLYSEKSEGKLFLENLYAMMEKDMKCNGVINGTWELGWSHGFSGEEIDLVVSEIESMLVSGLIEVII